MAKKFETVKWMTPWFTARFPKLQVADTEGQYADGKFKTDGIFEGAALEELEETLSSAAKTLWPGKEVTLPIKTFYANKDDRKAKKNPQGVGITMKSQRKPAILDGKRQRIPDTVKIGGGSIIRAACSISPYTKTEKVRVKNDDGSFSNEELEVFGITVYVNAVQVRKLVEGNSFGANAFDDDDEGFTYESSEDPAASQFGEATDL